MSVLSDINDEAGQATTHAMVDAGHQALYRRADVGNSAEVEALIQFTVDRFGRIDVLVNNAAIAIPRKVAEIAEKDYPWVLDLANPTSVWRGMHYAIPQMLRQGGGSIVSISSAQSLVGFSGWSAYAEAKGGINSLTRQAAVDYSRYNIRINAIAPGTIATR